MSKPNNINEYIAAFPDDIQENLRLLYKTIKDAVPDVEEGISYAMPAFKRNEQTIWFAAYKKHIGLYPMYGMKHFQEEMQPYRGKNTKDALHFPHNQPLPIPLIQKIVKYKLIKKLDERMEKIQTIAIYNEKQTTTDQAICEILATTINQNLPDAESKIWHGHPVWFLAGNPIAGYSKQKNGLRLMFWSGADFEEENLNIKGGKFKDASIFYNKTEEINLDELKRWLEKSILIQWDYKNIVKRKGVLERLK
jgi:uncharacterized protein YdhG (YjbR/CyaY superfamily)